MSREIKIGTFVPQYKGKDLSKVVESKLLKDDKWFIDHKYDGVYLQIHKLGNEIKTFTSSGLQVSIKEINEDILQYGNDFIIEAEYNNGGENGKMLNDRRTSSLSGAIADYRKGHLTRSPKCTIKIFDIIFFMVGRSEHINIRKTTYASRRWFLKSLFTSGMVIMPVMSYGMGTIEDGKKKAEQVCAEGGEGVFLFHSSHIGELKGRSNLAIKIKDIKRKVLKIVGGVESPTTKGIWGTLVLQDSDDRRQAFGGLSDEIKHMYPNIPDGNAVIRYESFTKGKYIQGFIDEIRN